MATDATEDSAQPWPFPTAVHHPLANPTAPSGGAPKQPQAPEDGNQTESGTLAGAA